jgi:hypothetical protein
MRAKRAKMLRKIAKSPAHYRALKKMWTHKEIVKKK